MVALLPWLRTGIFTSENSGSWLSQKREGRTRLAGAKLLEVHGPFEQRLLDDQFSLHVRMEGAVVIERPSFDRSVAP